MSVRALPSELKIMADIRPFEAWRYDPAKVTLDKVIAPPYDIISPECQKKLYENSPFNCVRLILNREEPSDNAVHNRYTRARAFMENWQREGVLIQDSAPCFYLYRQHFADPRTGEARDRSALLGRLRLEPFENGIVIPHEKTLAKPRQDRRNLLEATQTSFSPVFGLYEDPERKISSIYPAILKDQPLFEAADEEGIRHALWAISDPGILERIRETFADRKVYIADGHHRYQTALEYAIAERKKRGLPLTPPLSPEGRGKGEGIEPSDFVLMALVEFHDPGLILLPTHRMILPFEDFDADKAVEILRPYFKIEKISPEAMEKISAGSFGLCLKSGSFHLTLQNEAAAKKRMPAGKADVWYTLDVNLLAHLILASLWNLPENRWESVLRFTQSGREVLDSVKNGTAAAGFLLAPPQVEVLREMGRVRELMPQKSTYFYPKLTSGLVFYRHDAPGAS